MPDEILPDSIGITELAPLVLTSKQEELCARLDEFYSKHNLLVKPSDMFRGAMFAMRPELRSNPDWMAQAAHSLRDILYPFGEAGVPNKEEALRQYGSVRLEAKLTQELGKVFGSLTEITHHGNGRGNSVNYSEFSASDFDALVGRFENIMFDVLARQIDVHSEIDGFLGEVGDLSQTEEGEGK